MIKLKHKKIEGNMKKRILAVLVASLCAGQAMAETRTLSMGGAGVANGN